MKGAADDRSGVQKRFEPLGPLRMSVLLGFMSKPCVPWFAFVLYPSLQIGLKSIGERSALLPHPQKRR